MKKNIDRFFHAEPLFDVHVATFFIKSDPFSNGNCAFWAECAANFRCKVFSGVKRMLFPGFKVTLALSSLTFSEDLFMVKKLDIFAFLPPRHVHTPNSVLA